MSSPQQSFESHQTGIVSCERCHSPIVVRQANMVSVEFSVPCQKCGRRGIYYKRMINFEDAAGRRARA